MKRSQVCFWLFGDLEGTSDRSCQIVAAQGDYGDYITSWFSRRCRRAGIQLPFAGEAGVEIMHIALVDIAVAI